MFTLNTRPSLIKANVGSSIGVTKYHEKGRNYELRISNPTALSRDKAKGLVFLLGWTGCIDKSLVKYSTIYQNMGFSVIRFSPLFRALFSPRSLNVCRKHARKLVDLMNQEGGENNPVFIHSFSNGGCSLMRLLLDEFTDISKAKVNLKGLIVDSAPVPITFNLTYHVAVNIFPQFPGSKILAPIVASTFYPYMSFCQYFNRCVDWITDEPDTEYWRYFIWKNLSQQMEFNCPQLCLYSNADHITSMEYIEMFVEERLKRGVKVQVRVFQDSAHVSHLLKYPVEYESAMKDFVRECLK